LNSFIQVDKSEWEAFLEDLSELERKYKLLMNKLDMDARKLQTLTTPEKNEKKDVGSDDASRQVSMKSPEEGKAGEVKGGFLSRLKATLVSLEGSTGRITPLGSLRKPQGYASCSRCGFRLVRAARFCQRCGGDFGKTVCCCGRELGAGDRFCDRCGRGCEEGGG
jgi:hypothetical protein